jgi:hypothetical protein
MEMWRCDACRYLQEAAPSEPCPRCGADPSQFVTLDAGAGERIERTRFTNSLHMQLFSLLEDARDIADAGIEDGVDPACVRIFQEVEDFAAEMQNKIGAEIAMHVNDNRWG